MQEAKIKLESKIKDMITNGDLKMRPRWHFVTLGAIYTLGFVLLFLVCILFISALLFKSRTLPPQKAYELISNIETLPFIVLSLITLLLVTIYMLHSNYSFIYKRPALASILLLIILVSSLSYLIDIMNLHDRVERRLRDRPVFMIDKMYKPRYNQ